MVPAFEIILVPNGCSDGSEEICATLAERLAGVRCIASPESGWGRAVRIGIAAAGGRLIAYSNSARTQPQDLATVLQAALSEPLVVTKAVRPVRTLVRGIGSWLYNVECRILLRTGTQDVNGTPKVFPRQFDALSALQRCDDLIDLEFLCLCRRNGYPIREIALTHDQRHGGRSTTGWRTAVRLYAGAIQFWMKGLS
jgi:hypothetical protein